jgi:hypothetical protein
MHAVATHRLAAWVALVAILAATLLPAIMRTLGPMPAAHAWTHDVCISADTDRIPPSTGPSEPVTPVTHAAHCVLCASSCAAAAPPPGAACWTAHGVRHPDVVPRPEAGGGPPCRWPSPAPRGPPALA